MGSVLDALQGVSYIVVERGDDPKVRENLPATLLYRLDFYKRDNAECQANNHGEQFTAVSRRETLDSRVGGESNDPRNQPYRINEQGTSQRIVGGLDEEIAKSFQQSSPQTDILNRAARGRNGISVHIYGLA